MICYDNVRSPLAFISYDMKRSIAFGYRIVKKAIRLGYIHTSCLLVWMERIVCHFVAFGYPPMIEYYYFDPYAAAELELSLLQPEMIYNQHAIAVHRAGDVAGAVAVMMMRMRMDSRDADAEGDDVAVGVESDRSVLSVQ